MLLLEVVVLLYSVTYRGPIRVSRSLTKVLGSARADLARAPNPRDERRLENDGCVIWDTALAPVAPWFCGYVVLLDLWAMLDQLGGHKQAEQSRADDLRL